MSHPTMLPDNVVRHWQERLGDLLDRPDQEPLSVSMIGFYEIVKEDRRVNVGMVVIAANSRECRVFVATPDDYGMGQFQRVPGMTRAFREIRRGLPGHQQVVAVVYAKDVTVGGRFALVSTSFVPSDPLAAL